MPSTRGPSLMAPIVSDDGSVQAVAVPELDRTGPPFWRHHLAADPVSAAWRAGTALVVEVAPRPDGRWPGARQWVALGPARHLGPLLAALAAERPPPDRLSLEDVGVVPPWPHEVAGHWTWMYADAPPPDVPSPPVVALDEARDAARLRALLDAGHPESWSRPGDGQAEVWLGIEDGAALVAAGCVLRRRTGAGHLQGVVTHPDHRGRGLGRAVSAALTRRAQAGGSGVATLGVYAANAAAVRTYLSLGYRAPHTFRSGPVLRAGAHPGRGS